MDWDDILPNDLRHLWSSHFEMIQELKSIKFNRAIVPPDAINLDLTTLDFGDASQDLACSSIYTRFKRKQGDYSCQLIFARLRLVRDEYTQPRGIINDIHWNSTVKHSGVETTLREVLKTAYILKGRSLVNFIRSSCPRCRYINRKTIAVEMGPLSQDNLIVAPAFYTSQVDLAGPFSSYSQHHKRTTVGYLNKLLADEGGQLIKGSETMKLDIVDIQLHRDQRINFETCPVGGHNHHGRVERKIREVRSSLEKSMHNERLSIIQWKTMAAILTNSINDAPIAVRNVKGNFEMGDLLTPNRLILGRNNNPGPSGTLSVEND
ncbi:uncharacterized protein [Clytia hemisphaerica]|uniref:uncharacterized protein n=1 Tax=Clytia hemisphaerica TaxID=252671 RepID=UPI0034D5F65F